MQNTTLGAFATSLQSEVMEATYDLENPDFQHASFGNYVLDAITEEGQWPQHQLAYYQQDQRGELSAWGIDEITKVLYLAVVDWKSIGTVESLPQRVIKQKFNRLGLFLKNALTGTFIGEEGTEAAEAAYGIQHGVNSDFTSARLFFLSNRSPGEKATLPEIEIEGLPVHCELWGLEKISALMSSGQRREEITIDFYDDFEESIHCIGPSTSGEGVKIYSAFLPGKILGSIYVDHGPSLLELNVRSFLQARGKVNRGIRDTLVNEPERFLSYNNGITATASNVELSSDGKRIKRLTDLQIVNGGQTTASLARAVNAEIPMDGVMVHMKLVEVSPERAKALVPEISKYANRQNAVSEADLTSNHKFHVKIEELSKNSPVLVDGAIPTFWYYEKNRGSYQNMLADQGTVAKKNQFRRRYPTKQKFTKTDLAKYHNSWECRPWVVARGAQKCFAEFMAVLELDQNAEIPKEPDQDFFKALVGKKILFDRTDTIVRRENFGGWKAQITTYTIAYISNKLRKQLDFSSIWEHQGLSDALENALLETCRSMHEFLTNPPDGQNIGEFCKKEDAWLAAKTIEVKAEFKGLTGLTYRTPEGHDETLELLPEQEVALSWIKEVDAQAIDSLALWAFEHKWGRHTARQFLPQASAMLRTQQPFTPKQAAWLLKLEEAAREDGWSANNGL